MDRVRAGRKKRDADRLLVLLDRGRGAAAGLCALPARSGLHRRAGFRGLRLRPQSPFRAARPAAEGFGGRVGRAGFYNAVSIGPETDCGCGKPATPQNKAVSYPPATLLRWPKSNPTARERLISVGFGAVAQAGRP